MRTRRGIRSRSTPNRSALYICGTKQTSANPGSSEKQQVNGDTVGIDMLDDDGQSIFGAIKQTVVEIDRP